jgi:hypothetical protein
MHLVLTILIAILLAKWRKYYLRPIFRSWTIYPVLLAQGVILIFQASIFLGSTIFIPLAPHVTTMVILSFLFSILAYQLYLPAILGSLGVFAGTLLNKFVMAQNNHRMPVFPTLSYWTGYAKPESFAYDDGIHVLGSATTQWKWLTDYIDVGYSVLSPGDLLIHAFSVILLYATIKAANEKYNDSNKRVM